MSEEDKKKQISSSQATSSGSYMETQGGTRVKKKKTIARRIKRFIKTFQTDISKNSFNRWGSVLVFAFFILAVSGVIFGWAAILVVFLNEQVYQELCFRENSTIIPQSNHFSKLPYTTPSALLFKDSLKNSMTPLKGEGELNCNGRDLRFVLIWILSMVSLHVLQLPFGWLLDLWGSRVQTMIGTVLVFIGSVLFSVADSKTFDSYIPAAILLTVGGFIYYLGVLPLSSLYYPKIGTVVSIWSCAFDSSTVVFVLFLLINKTWSVKSNYIFAGYLIIPVMMVFMSIFWPYNREQERQERKYKESKMEKLDEEDSKDKEFNQLTFREQLFSLEFLVCLIYYFHSFWLNAFIGGIEIRLNILSGDKKVVDYYIEIMSWIFPASFILSPGIGFLIDKGGVILNVIILQLLTYSFNAVLFIPRVDIQIATFIIFSITRSYFYSFINSYFISTFGIVNFGKIYGVISCISGFTNLVQYLLFYLIVEHAGGKFWILDGLQVITNLATFVFLLHVILKKIRENTAQQQKYEKLDPINNE